MQTRQLLSKERKGDKEIEHANMKKGDGKNVHMHIYAYAWTRMNVNIHVHVCVWMGKCTRTDK